MASLLRGLLLSSCTFFGSTLGVLTMGQHPLLLWELEMG